MELVEVVDVACVLASSESDTVLSLLGVGLDPLHAAQPMLNTRAANRGATAGRVFLRVKRAIEVARRMPDGG